ncbi:MAG: DUF4837 family protein [Prolixibacteraceae bacterium]|jgi:hypothetical protein|nr:DUF4837 family protein [Prolixibacteraceae bacterium]
MKQLIQILTVFILIVLLGACDSRNQTSMKRNVTGKAGELVVVIKPTAWDNAPGKLIRDVLAQPQLSLPQEEPIFDLINIPHDAFGQIFRTSRNLLVVKIGNEVEENDFRLKRDVHAFTQAIGYIDAKTVDDFEKIFNENSDRLASFFMKAERRRLVVNYSKYYERVVLAKTEEQFGITLNVPPGFVVDKVEDDFMWIRFETPGISQGIFIYSFPYEDENTFTADYMKIKRNIVLHKNVPGPTESSYMSTESELPVVFNVFKKDGNYASEMRGLWTVENNFMGGPFINLAMLDILNNRVVVLDGFVYAPGKDKRNYLRQVEAMVYSSEFVNQDEIDKVNKQLDFEN